MEFVTIKDTEYFYLDFFPPRPRFRSPHITTGIWNVKKWSTSHKMGEYQHSHPWIVSSSQKTGGEVQSSVNPCWSVTDRRLEHLTWRCATAALHLHSSHSSVLILSKHLPSFSKQADPEIRDIRKMLNQWCFAFQGRFPPWWRLISFTLYSIYSGYGT